MEEVRLGEVDREDEAIERRTGIIDIDRTERVCEREAGGRREVGVGSEGVHPLTASCQGFLELWCVDATSSFSVHDGKHLCSDAWGVGVGGGERSIRRRKGRREKKGGEGGGG